MDDHPISAPVSLAPPGEPTKLLAPQTDVPALLQDFLANARLRGYSENTQRSYNKTIADLLAFLAGLDLRELRPAHLRQWMAWSRAGTSVCGASSFVGSPGGARDTGAEIGWSSMSYVLSARLVGPGSPHAKRHTGCSNTSRLLSRANRRFSRARSFGNWAKIEGWKALRPRSQAVSRVGCLWAMCERRWRRTASQYGHRSSLNSRASTTDMALLSLAPAARRQSMRITLRCARTLRAGSRGSSRMELVCGGCGV